MHKRIKEVSLAVAASAVAATTFTALSGTPRGSNPTSLVNKDFYEINRPSNGDKVVSVIEIRPQVPPKIQDPQPSTNSNSIKTNEKIFIDGQQAYILVAVPHHFIFVSPRQRFYECQLHVYQANNGAKATERIPDIALSVRIMNAFRTNVGLAKLCPDGEPITFVGIREMAQNPEYGPLKRGHA